MRNLRDLDVSNFVLFSRNTNKIDGANIAPLAHAPALRSLNLMGLNLHDADMAFVAQVKQLTTLNLIGNPITGQGLRAARARSPGAAAHQRRRERPGDR
jgi:hypothetical protein